MLAEQLVDKATLQRSAQRLMNMLEISGTKGVSLQYLIGRVEHARGCKINIIAAPLKDVYSGLSFRGTDGGYYLCYDNDLAGRPRLLIILHELIHILRGDPDALGALPLDYEMVLKAACGYSAEDLRKIPGLVCLRGSDESEETEPKVVIANDPNVEIEIDYAAGHLLQKVLLEEEMGFISSVQFFYS